MLGKIDKHHLLKNLRCNELCKVSKLSECVEDTISTKLVYVQKW